MYVGRIVAVGRTVAGRLAALYRVSSRSFPNRHAVRHETGVAIVPKPGHEQDLQRNPYIAYNCLRTAGTCGIVSNGAHTDPIAEKLHDGVGIRDALVSVLAGMDFEHDHLSTPRIAAVVDRGTDAAYLGIVRRDALLVRRFALQPGQAAYVATYEHHDLLPVPADTGFDAADAADACRYILGQGAFAQLERPVSAACLLATATDYDIAAAEAEEEGA